MGGTGCCRSRGASRMPVCRTRHGNAFRAECRRAGASYRREPPATPPAATGHRLYQAAARPRPPPRRRTDPQKPRPAGRATEGTRLGRPRRPPAWPCGRPAGEGRIRARACREPRPRPEPQGPARRRTGCTTCQAGRVRRPPPRQSPRLPGLPRILPAAPAYRDGPPAGSGCAGQRAPRMAPAGGGNAPQRLPQPGHGPPAAGHLRRYGAEIADGGTEGGRASPSGRLYCRARGSRCRGRTAAP